MDTTTHITTGVGLAGLSLLDPTVASHPELVTIILLCTVLGSNAPDLDFLYTFKGNETYLKKHRGLSHSIPALFLWSFIIASLATLGTGGSFFVTLFCWTFFSVSVHVEDHLSLCSWFL